MDNDVDERLRLVEERVAVLEKRQRPKQWEDAEVKSLVKDFVLTQCCDVGERSEGTWVADLYAWFAAFCTIDKAVETPPGVCFARALRLLKVECRSWQVKRADEQRSGVVALLAPTDEVRKKHATFVVDCTPGPDSRQSGPTTLRKIREYANRRLRMNG